MAERFLAALTAVVCLCAPASARAEPPATAPAAAVFAGLERYAGANAALPAPARDEGRVVFIGDSITEGWSTVDPAFARHRGWVNRGIGGQTTPQMLLRFRQDVIALRPSVVHIMAGTNDIAGNVGPMDPEFTHANIASMVEIAFANGVEVVLASVPPARYFWWNRDIQPGPAIQALNDWLRAYAQQKGLVYVDYYTALSDGAFGIPERLAPDGCHPSVDGYRVMVPLAEAGIGKALGRHRRAR